MPPVSAVAANPYASWSLMAQGELSEQVNAVPLSQPDLVSGSEIILSFLSHDRTGSLTAALPDHAQLIPKNKYGEYLFLKSCRLT